MRALEDTRSFDNAYATAAYTHCLLRANFELSTVKGVELKPGQFITSTDKFAEECGMTYKQMRTALQRLEEDGLITREPVKRGTSKKTDYSADDRANNAKRNGTLITVVNYGVDDTSIDYYGEYLGEQMDTIQDGKAGNSIRIKNKNLDLYKDTRNINPGGLMDGDSSHEHHTSDEIQQQIESIVQFMDEMGFDYSSANGAGGIRGILGKYLRKEKVNFHILVGYVYKTVDRDITDRGNEDDLAYFIRCVK